MNTDGLSELQKGCILCRPDDGTSSLLGACMSPVGKRYIR